MKRWWQNMKVRDNIHYARIGSCWMIAHYLLLFLGRHGYHPFGESLEGFVLIFCVGVSFFYFIKWIVASRPRSTTTQ